MPVITRVTDQTLDVLEVLLRAHRAGREVYGYQVKKETRRYSAVIHGVLGRLEDGGLVESHWDLSPGSGPRRRYYQLTAAGVDEAARLLAQRRPGAMPPAA